MPAYNCAEYISEAIHSLQIQSIQEWEVIVIDDGSTDDTTNIVNGLATQDPRICLLRQPPSGKPSITRNTGLAAARGEFICFLDADDFYGADKFARCLCVMEQYPEADLLFHDVNYTDKNGKNLTGSYLARCNFRNNARKSLTVCQTNIYHCEADFYFYLSTAKNSTILPSSVFIRRKENIRFSNDLLRGEDLDLWLRLLSQSRQFFFIDDTLAYYRRHDSNLTKNHPPIEKDRIYLHETNYFRSKHLFNLKKRLAYRYYIAGLYSNGGYELLQIGRNGDSFSAYLNALLWIPNWFSIKGIIKILAISIRLIKT